MVRLTNERVSALACARDHSEGGDVLVSGGAHDANRTLWAGAVISVSVGVR